MHTVFRVYGNAIGRTALCSRTVGRGFKSVSRIIGRGPDDDRLNEENKRAIARANYERDQYMKTLTRGEKKEFLQREKEAKHAAQNRFVDDRIGIVHPDSDEEKPAPTNPNEAKPVPTKPDVAEQKDAKQILAQQKRAQTLADAEAFAERLRKDVDAMVLAKQLAEAKALAEAEAKALAEAEAFAKKLYDEVVAMNIAKDLTLKQSDAMELAKQLAVKKLDDLVLKIKEQKKALQEKKQKEKDEAKYELITTHDPRIRDEQQENLKLKQAESLAKAEALAEIARQDLVRVEEGIKASLEPQPKKAQLKKNVIIIDSESDEDEGSDTHIEQIGTAEDNHEIRQTEINVLSVEIDAMGVSLVDDIRLQKIKRNTKEHKDRTEAIKEMKKILSQLIRTDRILTHGDLNRIDEGFTEIAKINEHWNEMQKRLQKLDNEFIYNTQIDGIFQPVQSDFQMIQFKSKAKAKKQADAIIDEEVSKGYLETHHDFTKQNEKILYTDEGTIAPSKKFEFGFCGNANQQAVSALFNKDTNFETTDAFCIENKIPGSSSTPIDLFDKLRKRMLECKYYKSENFVKMYNCNMIDQIDYYFTLKKQLYRILNNIKINQLKNIIVKESITERDKLLQILRTKNDFLRAYYANNEYLSINVSANKWAVVPNVRTLANNQIQINNFIRHANTKTTVEYNAARQITGWTAMQGNFEVVNDKYERLLFTDDKGHINYDYYITTMFNGYVGLYDFTHDTLLDGYRHIIEVYKVGPATDQRNTKKVRGFTVVNELMDSIKIPIEKFYNESMFVPYVLPQQKVKVEKDTKVKAI
jgi:hypothetical protein